MKQQILSDVISRINVARRSHMKSILIPNANLARKLMFLFEEIGLIRGFLIIEHSSNVEVMLKYNRSQSVIHEIKQVSKPRKRVYASLIKLKHIKENGNKIIYIISTNKGLLLVYECLKLGICCEFLLKIII